MVDRHPVTCPFRLVSRLQESRRAKPAPGLRGQGEGPGAPILREEISEEARALLDHYKMPLKKRPMVQAPIRRKETAEIQYQLKLK